MTSCSDIKESMRERRAVLADVSESILLHNHEFGERHLGPVPPG